MIYIAGDIHGTIDVGKIIRFFSDPHLADALTKQDYLILLGDTSVCWDDGKADAEVKRILRSLPVTTLFIDGNHDNHQLLAEYPVLAWNGGHVHEIEPDILHLMRGEVFTIEGKTFFTFGGAYSIDKHTRIEGVSWWPEELPSAKEYARGWANLRENGYAVDVILTHTAPQFVVDALGMECVDEEEALQNYLQEVAENVTYDAWYCGHFHEDAEVDGQIRVLMEDIVCL